MVEVKINTRGSWARLIVVNAHDAADVRELCEKLADMHIGQIKIKLVYEGAGVEILDSASKHALRWSKGFA